MESKGSGERRRVFSAEFKLEALRRMEERRAGGVNLTQIGRELGVSVSGFHDAVARAASPPSPHMVAEERLRVHVQAVHPKCTGSAPEEPRALRSAAPAGQVQRPAPELLCAASRRRIEAGRVAHPRAFAPREPHLSARRSRSPSPPCGS